ncbi:MAG: L,D-transpeptidase [Syntrophobacteraceae bacterium]
MSAYSLRSLFFMLFFFVFSFCTTAGIHAAELYGNQGQSRISQASPPDHGPGWSYRVISQKELERLSERDADLSPSASLRLLAKLNARDFDYIAEDIRQGRPIKVPHDFSRFKTWTPLYKHIRDVADLPRFILIVKDIHYIGWYERGNLIGDTYICIGKDQSRTDAGLFKVLEKDSDHVSRSYPNAWGEPAPMPYALRIYGLVWIHAGDIVGGRCSHGCVNLPILPAMQLFHWATPGTPVIIVEALSDVPSVLAANRSSCTLRASLCRRDGKS